MPEVHLSRGAVAIVDEVDLERVNAFKWSLLTTKRGKRYAVRSDNGKTVYLHRFVIEAGPSVTVDHCDSDGLNCQRRNLRIATRTTNNRNRVKPVHGATSRFKGVDRRRSGKYRAQINLGGTKHCLGHFDSEIDAAKAYDAAAIAHFGEFARLNLPDLAEVRQ